MLLQDYPDDGRPEIVQFVPIDAAKVLDVGCSTGAFGSRLVSRGHRVLGVEPNLIAADRARAHFPVVHGVFPDDVPDERFDCVVFNDVLEHMVDPWASLRATHDLLSDVGVVVASLPNMRYFPVLRDLVLRGKWEYTDYGVLDRTHLRWFTRSSMLQLFVQCGYEVVSITPIARRSNWKLRAVARIPRFADLPTKQFVVVARSAGLDDERA